MLDLWFYLLQTTLFRYLFRLPIHTPKKLITKAKTSHCVPFDIHKSNLIIVKDHSFNFGKTYFCFVFSTKWNKTFHEFIVFKRNTTFGCKWVVIHFNYVLFTNWIGSWFSTTKRSKSCKNCFCYTTSLLKGSFA